MIKVHRIITGTTLLAVFGFMMIVWSAAFVPARTAGAAGPAGVSVLLPNLRPIISV